MEMLGLKETVVQMAIGVRWYGHVLRKDDGHDFCFEKSTGV